MTTARLVVIALMVLHGGIHLIGVAKAFGWAAVPQLTQPISTGLGIGWGSAAVLFVAAAALSALGVREWWSVTLAAVVVSQAVIIWSWADARFGTVANLLLAVVAIHAAATEGPWSLRREYQDALRARIVTAAAARGLIREEDLARLPPMVRRYLTHTGVAIGQPRVHNLRARWRGRIRGGPDEAWMDFVAEQYNFLDEPSRFFFMDARKGRMPVDVFHAFTAGAATMRVRLLSLVPLVSADGDDLTRAETVTLLNDLCLLAPAGLLDADIRWEAIDERSARVHYTLGGQTVSAQLVFDPAGALVNFVSDDRLAQSGGGRAWLRQRWSTPMRDVRGFGPWRLASRGEGRWHAPAGEYTYIELELLDLATNVTRR